MIVPSTRLLGLVAAMVVPLATLAGAMPRTRMALLVVAAGMALLAARDALAAAGRLRAIEARAPLLTRATEGRACDLRLLLCGAPAMVPLRLALAMPEGLTALPDEQQIAVAGPEVADLCWPLSGARRGRYRVATLHLEAPSPWSLWIARRDLPIEAEIRVYPSLDDRTRVLARLLKRGQLGTHARSRIGKGREIEQLREYVQGDALEDVHWKATARHGRPITRVYQIERTQEVYAVVDASRLAARPLDGRPALDAYVRSALVLAVATRQHGDLFGLVTFGEGVRRFLPARAGTTHFGACREALYAETPEPVSPDHDEIATFLRTRLRRRALLVFLTDLEDAVVAESFLRAARLLARHHLIQVCMPRPPHARPIFEEPVASRDEIYARLAGHLAWHSLEATGSSLSRAGASLAMVDGDRLVAETVSRYVAIKERQLL